MRHDRPTSAELVEAVQEFLDQRVRPQLEGHLAFHARVASNVLAIVKRQLELGPELNAAEQQRLAALLQQQGTLEELNRELCRRIRDQELGLEHPELVDHLWKTTRGKLSLDNPKYKSLASEKRGESGQS